MPVVAKRATSMLHQTSSVQPLRGHASPNGFADPMHPALQGHVLVLTEVAGHVLDVATRTQWPSTVG